MRAPVVVFHSMFGLRDVERAAADRLRAEGHQVVLPDLFDGLTAPGDLDAGFALTSRVGWDTIVARGRHALRPMPDAPVLLGFSMGVGVIGQLWPERLDAAAVICLHATTSVPSGVATGTPFQLHVGADDDRFGSTDLISSSLDSARRAGAAASAHRYAGAGHFYTDPTLTDFDADATALTWTRVLALLA